MAKKLPRSFIKDHRQFFRIFSVGVPKERAEELLKNRRQQFPNFRFAIKRESDGSYSIGRTARPESERGIRAKSR